MGGKLTYKRGDTFFRLMIKQIVKHQQKEKKNQNLNGYKERGQVQRIADFLTKDTGKTGLFLHILKG